MCFSPIYYFCTAVLMVNNITAVLFLSGWRLMTVGSHEPTAGRIMPAVMDRRTLTDCCVLLLLLPDYTRVLRCTKCLCFPIRIAISQCMYVPAVYICTENTYYMEVPVIMCTCDFLGNMPYRILVVQNPKKY